MHPIVISEAQEEDFKKLYPSLPYVVNRYIHGTLEMELGD